MDGRIGYRNRKARALSISPEAFHARESRAPQIADVGPKKIAGTREIPDRREFDLLLEGTSTESDILPRRPPQAMHAQEIDGKVVVNRLYEGNLSRKRASFLRCRITAAHDRTWLPRSLNVSCGDAQASLYDDEPHAKQACHQAPLPDLKEAAKADDTELPFLQRPLPPDRFWAVGQRRVRDSSQVADATRRSVKIVSTRKNALMKPTPSPITNDRSAGVRLLLRSGRRSPIWPRWSRRSSARDVSIPAPAHGVH